MTTCLLTLYYCPDWGSDHQTAATDRLPDLSPIRAVDATRYGDQNRTQVEFHIEGDVVGTMDLMGHLEPVDVDYESLCDALALAGVGYSEACAMIDAAIDWVVQAAARSKLVQPEAAGGS